MVECNDNIQQGIKKVQSDWPHQLKVNALIEIGTTSKNNLPYLGMPEQRQWKGWFKSFFSLGYLSPCRQFERFIDSSGDIIDKIILPSY